MKLDVHTFQLDGEWYWTFKIESMKYEDRGGPYKTEQEAYDEWLKSYKLKNVPLQ